MGHDSNGMPCARKGQPAITLSSEHFTVFRGFGSPNAAPPEGGNFISVNATDGVTRRVIEMAEVLASG
jgi:hypothetical protein